MSGFRGFSEAARLYAENIPVVEAMRNLTEEEVRQFRDALRTAVQGLVAPLRLTDDISEEPDGDWHGWMVARAKEDVHSLWKGQKVPWVIFNGRPAVLVPSAELVCYVPGPPYLKAGEAEMARVAGLADDPEMQAVGVARSADSWALLTVRVVWGDGDMVETVASALAGLLRKLDQIRRL